MNDRESLYNQAFAAYKSAQQQRAQQLLQQLLQRWPGDPRAALLKGVVHPKGDPTVGVALVEQAAFGDPFEAQSWYNLGVFEAERGRLELALACYERAVQFDPLHVDALGNGCELLRRFDRFDEALEWADRQLSLGADSWAPHLNRAVCLLHVRRFADALAAFKQAEALDHKRPIIKWEAFSLHLFEKRFKEAWDSFEFRFACGHLNGVFHYPFPQPQWAGENLAGKHLLVHNEQGLGDQIMFACALNEVIEQAGQVTLVVSPELEELFRASFAKARVLPAFNGRFAGDHPAPPWLDQLGHVDYQIPIGSLMHLLRNTPESFANVRPWMRPTEGAAARWKARIASLWEGGPRKLRVGLCWASNPAFFRLDSSRRAAKKSMRLEAMAPLMDVQGADFVSVLNWRIDPMPAPMRGRLLDLSAELRSMEDTAALIEQLDLVITVDTAVAHLAGAMGRPVWLLLHDFADCRWALEGADSYWYPSMRLFRQNKPGDWAQVIDDTKRALAAFDGHRS
jgi:tetratricopeptide (TPR) repeat protein